MDTAHAAEKGLSIHLAPDVLGYFLGVPITNTLLTTWFVALCLIVFAILFSRRIQMVPGKVQLVIEEFIQYTHNFVHETLCNRKLSEKVFPLVMTIFFFVLFQNWVELLPGVDSFGIHKASEGGKLIGFLHPATADLNLTAALALISLFVVEFIGISLLGARKYVKKFINFKSPIAFMVGIIELFSEFARTLAFAFRLFGNIFAGDTLIFVAIFFLPYFLPVPILGFEIFVGFIQAFIFAILTLFFIKLALEEPH
jgi:F-type H+-transporting ATPase subunit a